ncbi:riboflavin synthase [Solibacillus sp. FSL K6-4121]|uniref:riboflavin synthase n=1 Tax=Solibacillus sp. FSL K6-4121 TaxID=2921505 RepID=UPI0030F6020F
MFTGIIEELGTVEQISQSTQTMELAIRASKILEDVKLGDSIAVNGVCLTVKQFTSNSFLADVMPETVKATSLQQLTVGMHVNLERAMLANGRFGGHIVSGHVDGVAIIQRKRPVANAVYVDLAMDRTLVAQCIERGSITVDGISLTIFNMTDTLVTISLIPHTYEQTVLGYKKAGDVVNIEIDLIGKYVKKHLQNQTASTITKELLQRTGF